MMDEDKTRSTQTKCKHIILKEYLKAWGGIIYWGLQNSKMSSTPRFVYVDCFSHTGIYPGGDIDEPNKEPVYGSPIIGIQAVDELAKTARDNDFPIETYSILVERDGDYYNTLIETLHSLGYSNRIKISGRLNNLNNKEIIALNKDTTELVGELLEFTDHKDTWAFYLLDPSGAGIPYTFVEPIVRGKNHDVMINFIYEDLARKAGMFFSDDISPQHKKQAENWKRVFDSNIWEDEIYTTLLIDNSAGETLLPEEKEELFAEGYYKSLNRMDPNAIIKFINLRYPNKERTMLYLFLTTHDPTGALKMNEVLYKTQLLEYELRHKVPMAGRMRSGQKSFLDASYGIDIGQGNVVRPNKKEISRKIYSEFSGKTTTRRGIYRSLVDTDYFPQEVDKGIRHLRREGKCQFEGNLTHDIEIRVN